MAGVSPILGLGVGLYVLKVVIDIFTKFPIGWLGTIAWICILLGIVHSLWITLQGE